MKTPTLTDVARRAGVSYATADRVVNARGGVAAKSVAKVRAAVDDLGYVRNVAAANLSTGRTYRFAYLIPDGANAFFQDVRRILGAVFEPGVVIEVIDVPAFDSAALCARLDGLAGYDGVTVIGIDDADVAGAMARLRAQGVAVVSMVSDVATEARAAYVGIDNVAAGRTAGRLMALAHGRGPGRVLPVIGSLSARDHADRLAGFREVLGAATGLTLAPVIEGRDRADMLAAQVRAAMDAGPEITGIYNIGAGQSGLADMFADWPARPICIVHELSARTRRALEAGLFDFVIDQRPADEVAGSLMAMRALADRLALPALPTITPMIYVQDNLPQHPDREETS